MSADIRPGSPPAVSKNMNMYVLKRNGDKEEVSFDKVLNRIKNLSDSLNVNVFEVAQKVCSRIFDGVKTSDLDELAAQMCSSMMLEHPDYGKLASRIIVSNHQKNTSPSFSETVQLLFDNLDTLGDSNPLVTEEFYGVVMKNKEKLNSSFDYSRDYLFDYFGFKTLEKAYLMRVDGRVVERPQHMFMRVAIGIHGGDIKDALQTYDLMSQKYFIHATPTLFNAGTRVPQLSSCYLEAMEDDSIEGIYNTLKDCALISKYAGGIGVHIHNVRSRNAMIRGTNGTSSGIIPMLRVFNNTARYVNQAGRRLGSIAVYLEPWHADVEMFIEMRKNHGNEEERARDLFYALWIPDLFMERVRDDGVWSLMCPDRSPGLSEVYGDAFKELYEKYEREGRYVKQMRAQDLWFRILENQIETGTPYMLYKDHVNKKNNQKNLGTIKSSNLCVAPETMILTETGYLPIGELAGEHVRVWNGKEFSDVVVQQTGIDQHVIRVKFDNGLDVRCTPYHDFYIVSDDGGELVCKIKASELKPGMKMLQFDVPVINDPNSSSIQDAYSWGLIGQNKSERIVTQYLVPVHYNLETRLQWLAGLCDAYGELNNGQINIPILDANTAFMKHVIYLLQTLGINANVHGYNITISTRDVSRLIAIGFMPRIMELSHVVNASQCERCYVKVAAIEDTDDVSDTYCFNEPKEHKGVFNGVLAGQCVEIMEYSDPTETAVCNLSSIGLPTYFNQKTGVYDFEKLHDVVKVIVKNLNKVIDVNFYPIEKARKSNMCHRPIGIGVQGLADLFALMKLPFESVGARRMNREIFETMYHAAVEASMELAKKYGPYETFAGSPASEGKLQFDLWGVEPGSRYNWDALKAQVVENGLRNSLLIAPMPTASTSQIMGFSEAFEPFTSNIYKRKTLAGEFILVNKYLIEDLSSLGLWNSDMKNKIIVNDGSIQGILEIPEDVRELYKTVWEIKMRSVIDMAADRGAFVDQSQSMNLFVESPDFKKLSSMHFYAWGKGLKTGMYYLRTRSKAKTQQFTIDPNISRLANVKSLPNIKEKEEPQEEPQVCESCSA